MSIQAINWALGQAGSPTQKHVLLVLANYANESGHAFPSNILLAAKTGLTDRAVRNAKKALLMMGIIEKSGAYGRGAVRLRLECTLSHQTEHRAAKAEPHSVLTHPEPRSAQSESKDYQTERRSAPYNHQLTTNNHHTPYSPPKDQKSKAKKTSAHFTPPDWVPGEAWNGWLEMRRAKKKPATLRAMELSVQKLDDLRRQGQNPGDVLDNCTLHGWQGIYPIKGYGLAHSFAPPTKLSPTEQNRAAIFAQAHEFMRENSAEATFPGGWYA